METYDQKAKQFSGLSHPVRLRIADILADGEQCVCHLSTVLQQRQAYVSQQLAILRDTGLIADRKEGLYVYYRLTEVGERLLRTYRAVRDSTEPPSESGDEGARTRPAVAGCPCPRCQAVSALADVRTEAAADRC